MSKIPHSIPATRFDVFVVEDYIRDGAEKANWIRIGVAFENKDGNGFNVQLAALPLTGKLVLRPRAEGGVKSSETRGRGREASLAVFDLERTATRSAKYN